MHAYINTYMHTYIKIIKIMEKDPGNQLTHN